MAGQAGVTGSRAGLAGDARGRSRFLVSAGAGWLEQFPARQVPRSWPSTELERAKVQDRLLRPPFALAKPAARRPAGSG